MINKNLESSDGLKDLFIFIIAITILTFFVFYLFIHQFNENKVCLGGHYEIRNEIIDGRLYPHSTFICDSSKIIYK